MKNIAGHLGIVAMSAIIVTALSGCALINPLVSSNSKNAENNTENVSNTSTNTNNTSHTSNTSNTFKNTNSNNANKEVLKPASGNRFGRSSTGYVTVPEDWMDATGKLDSRKVDSSHITYIVDPTTEFTSGVEYHWAYASSISLETFPCKYTEKADEMLYKYRGETDNYTEPSISKTQFNGENASIVKTSSADGVDIANICIEKDANSCIMISVWGTPSNFEAIMGYADTWSMMQ